MDRRALLPLAMTLLPARPAPACARPDEPSLGALASAALRTASLDAERVRSLARRARGAAFLPQLIVRAGRGAYDATRDSATADPALTSSDTVRIDVTLRFSLDRWVYNPGELRVIEGAGRLAEHRLALLEHVAALWAERRQLARAPPGPDPAREADRCAELTAVLDALTGGALTITLPVSRPRP